MENEELEKAKRLVNELWELEKFKNGIIKIIIAFSDFKKLEFKDEFLSKLFKDFNSVEIEVFLAITTDLVNFRNKLELKGEINANRKNR